MVSFNPISYTSYTEKGNQYRRSNLFKTVGLIGSAGVAVALHKNKNGVLFISTENSIKKLFSVDFSDTTKKVLKYYDRFMDIGFPFVLGYLVDKFINKNRAERADMDCKA